MEIYRGFIVTESDIDEYGKEIYEDLCSLLGDDYTTTDKLEEIYEAGNICRLVSEIEQFYPDGIEIGQFCEYVYDLPDDWLINLDELDGTYKGRRYVRRIGKMRNRRY